MSVGRSVCPLAVSFLAYYELQCRVYALAQCVPGENPRNKTLESPLPKVVDSPRVADADGFRLSNGPGIQRRRRRRNEADGST